MKQVILMTFLAAVCVSCACAQAAGGEVRTVRLLTVGNSFSGNATRYLGNIAAAAGDRLILGRADLPGCPMDRHWKAAEAAEADPKSLAGRPYSFSIGGVSKQCSLKEILGSEKWDFVTIQQASMISTDISTYRPYARNLRDYIKKNAPQAEVLIHETWAYRCDDPRFAKDDDSQETMHSQLQAAYRTTAKDLGLRIIPVGDAMYAADTNKTWRYKPAVFDKATLKYPDLPEQTDSLHVGWWWNKTDDGDHRLVMDGHHASALGCYLAGCVWYEVLFGKSVEDNTFVPEGVTSGSAKFLRSLAHQIVQNQ